MRFFNLRGHCWEINDMKSFQETRLWTQPYWRACEALHQTAVWGGEMVFFYTASDLFLLRWFGKFEVIFYSKSRSNIKFNPLLSFVSLFICLCRSSTHSMYSKCSASSCGWLIVIIITLRVYLLSPFSPLVSHFMRSARWVCSGILHLIYV